ncbi:ROK family transcriptional regulator [Nocardioides bruguierae]|uniref:ROK family protein n=1 Tax=Nocardioides bruguierae TaxID=2945102 RepID=A0A9X2IFH4_9ACTN|nr:ROK family protein [Nocardioides bruguierae]MCL8025580.1 ROK family protein [Nocardioides bruguierae]MCM0620439.1 ROK family protein [Nocardioides bruguierae]
MPDVSEGATELLRLVASSRSETRASIARVTGWARNTVNARLDELLDLGLVTDTGAVGGSRGRPAARFSFDASAGSLLIADVGASAARFAHVDLRGAVLSQQEVSLDITAGPEPVLDAVVRGLEALPTRDDLPAWALGVSLPGPIEQPAGRVVSPPIMTGWDGMNVPEVLGPRLRVPVLVENDVNAMAWGEVVSTGRMRDLLFVKVGTGVGAGLVLNGALLSGARGAAGDLGHTHVGVGDGAVQPLCRCGKRGCVEAYAGGWAIARDLNDAGVDAAGAADVVARLQAGDPVAVDLVREAGRVLGAGIAAAVSLVNPAEVVIGGQLSHAGEHLLMGIREKVAAYALPLATQELVIRTASRPHDVGLVGLVDRMTRWALEHAHLSEILRRVGVAS